MMNSRLSKLDIYPFWRPQTLLEAENAPAGMINGERNALHCAGTRKAQAHTALATVPGSAMSPPGRPGGDMAQRGPATSKNPGAPYIRVALVHDRNFAEDALTRIANVLNG
jgi:hypothetical protein